MDIATLCPLWSDNQVGPRIDPACRSFDFTLLFEDAFFIALPASLFIATLPIRLTYLWNIPAKLTSYRLALWKLTLFFGLLVLHLMFLAVRLESPSLNTNMSLASGILSVVATMGGLVESFLEDQRSIKPSDLIVVYQSVAMVLAVPRLRTIWLLPSVLTLKVVWTGISILTTGIILIESVGKLRLLKWVNLSAVINIGTPAYKGSTREETTGFWGRSFFIWLLPFFRIGSSKILSLEDVPHVDSDLKGAATFARLEASWPRYRRRRFGLARATLAANAWPFVSAAAPRLALSAFTFCQPFLLDASVSYLNGDTEVVDRPYFGQGLVGAFVLVYLGIAISRAVYSRQAYRLLARVRAGLTTKIYQHTTALHTRHVQDSAVLTLMGTDVERIVSALRSVHELWANVFEITIGVWLLTRQVSFASIMPLAICLASLVGTSFIAKYFGPAQKIWVERVEKRVSATANMLNDMKAVKMLGLEDMLSKEILHLRKLEMQGSEKFRQLLVWSILIGNSPGTIAPFATLAIYAIISITRADGALQAAQAFTSIALISLVTDPLLQLCQALPSLTQAMSCFSRIEAFLLVNPASSSSQALLDNHSTSQNDVQLQVMPSSDSLFVFENATITWSPDDSLAALHDLSLTIRPGFTAIIGPVGAGKTTLLSSIIGQTALRRGLISPSLSGVAYCSQIPWIIDDTIERNITGDSEFDQKWFQFSLTCCSLDNDIDNMPAGYKTVAGTNGSSLSGGQKQRVALARAIYSRLPVIILDDVFSGQDPTTARNIFTTLMSTGEGYLRKSGVSVILATHDSRILPLMDTIVTLDSGRLVAHGSYGATKQEASHVLKRLQQPGQSDDVSQNEVEIRPVSEPIIRRRKNATPSTSILHDDHRQRGSWSVYIYYGKSAGILPILFWALSTLVGAVANSYSTIWVGRWTEQDTNEGTQQIGLNLGIYFLLVALATLGPVGECWIFFIGIINDTAIKLHSDLLAATLGASYEFLQKTDVGVITNRFSQDMNLIDLTLPSQAIQFTSALAWGVAQLVVICVLGKYLAAIVPVVGAALFVVQRYYLQTSRQVRLLDIEAKAPLYTHFMDTIKGLSTIRAFRWEDTFRERLLHNLNESQNPFYMLFCIQQWLTLVLDLIVGFMAVVLAALAIFLTGSISAGALGVGLVLTLQFNGLLTQTIQAWTKLETSIGAVARVQQFVEETLAEPSGTEEMPPRPWPENGALEFHGITAAYTTDGPPALSNFSLKISAGEKIAVCGRSGSGKTTMIMALLKMITIRSGEVTIDGVGLGPLGGKGVRSVINLVPQDPYFMPGTLSFNLDCQRNLPGQSIETAVQKVGLWDKVRSRGGLEADFAPTEWSHGERQLLCLARALLVPSKILVLDEATSSVDEETQAVMQVIIEREFRDRTVIAILHRYTYIHYFDRVAVLKSGRLVEYGKPSTLLEETESAFAELYSAVGG